VPFTNRANFTSGCQNPNTGNKKGKTRKARDLKKNHKASIGIVGTPFNLPNAQPFPYILSNFICLASLLVELVMIVVVVVLEVDHEKD